jgi:hypothetical protein
MIYKHLESIIKEMIGKNGYEACNFKAIHTYLSARDFKKCVEIIESCEALHPAQKKQLKVYVLSYENAC